MVATVAEVVPIEAPSADQGATLDVSALVVKKPLTSLRNGPPEPPRKAERLYHLKAQLIVAFFDKCVIFVPVCAGRAGGWCRQPKGADGKDWP
jgi:hypothetical protein